MTPIGTTITVIAVVIIVLCVLLGRSCGFKFRHGFAVAGVVA